MEPTKTTDLHTPWDDLDLDLMVGPKRPAFKLSPPLHYFSILPSHPTLEQRWNLAGSAAELRIIVHELVEYERSIARRLVALNLHKTETQEEIHLQYTGQFEASEPASVSSAAPAPNLRRSLRLLTRKRATTEVQREPMSSPKRTRLRADRSTQDTKSLSQGVSVVTTSAIKDEYAPNQGQTPKLEPPYSNNPSVDIPHLHEKLHAAVETLYSLVTQAEELEKQLLSHTHGSTTSTSPPLLSSSSSSSTSNTQSLPSQSLAQSLQQTQLDAHHALNTLDHLSLTTLGTLGPGSVSLSHFKSTDSIRRHLFASYDLQLDWQMRQRGLFSWWLG